MTKTMNDERVAAAALPTQGAPVRQLAEYVRDTVIRINFEDSMLARCAEFRAREQKLRNEQITDEFGISQEKKRVATLREIMARTPGATAIDNRQIMSLEKAGSERFLSPAAQLVAAEIQISDLKLGGISRERDLVKSTLKRDYYCSAQQTLQKLVTGRAFLEELRNIQSVVFQNQDKSIDIVEQTWNELDVERESWINTYLQGMRFVAPPEGTETVQRQPGLAPSVVLGGLLGGMFGVMFALVRGWWRGSRDAIETSPKA
jgi:hypothetical protein